MLALCRVSSAAKCAERFPSPDEAGSFSHLQEAAALLAACGRAPELAAGVDNALAASAPQFVLDALAPAPGGGGGSPPAARARALRVLSQLASAPEGSSPLRDARLFFAAASRLLTAAEAADLPRPLPFGSGDHELSCATAQLVAGFVSRSVGRVSAAATALERLSQPPAPPPPSQQLLRLQQQQPPAAVPLAVARLLLGSPEGAASAASASSAASYFVASFDPPMLGLVALAESWLARSGLPSFWDTANASPKLGGWYEAPSVAEYLAASPPMRMLIAARDAAAERSAAEALRRAGAHPDYSRFSDAARAPPPSTLDPPPSLPPPRVPSPFNDGDGGGSGGGDALFDSPLASRLSAALSPLLSSLPPPIGGYLAARPEARAPASPERASRVCSALRCF